MFEDDQEDQYVVHEGHMDDIVLEDGQTCPCLKHFCIFRRTYDVTDVDYIKILHIFMTNGEQLNDAETQLVNDMELQEIISADHTQQPLTIQQLSPISTPTPTLSWEFFPRDFQ